MILEDIECPLCAEIVQIDPFSREHYEGSLKYVCSNCGKEFSVIAETVTEYEAYCEEDEKEEDEG